MSRVEVKPSKQLVARLEQQQRNQQSTLRRERNAEAGQAPPEEDRRKQEEERVTGAQSEEDNDRDMRHEPVRFGGGRDTHTPSYCACTTVLV